MVQEAEVKKQEFDPIHINPYLKDIASQFQIYVEDIQPLIINIEELKAEFPSEILNEVRAMYTHLCRAFIANDAEAVVANIEKIKRHTKRALLDCYKNTCIIILDQRKFFFEKYKGVDLSLISKGEFLEKELTAYREAVDTLKEAKKAEGLNIKTDELFMFYQTAYQKALVLDDIINTAEEDALYLKRKAMKRDIVAYAFGVVGVIGTIFTIASFFLS